MTNHEKIERVKKWQNSPFVHALTCRNDSNHALLEPKEVSGKVVLVCENCGYVQKHIPEVVLDFDVQHHEEQMKQWVADARGRGPVSQDKTEEMARRATENDNQKVLGEVKAVRDPTGGAMLNYLHVLTPEEELQRRREHFAKIRPRSLFDLGMKKFFLAVKKIDELSWEVIELTDENRTRLVRGQPCERSILRFDDMKSINLR